MSIGPPDIKLRPLEPDDFEHIRRLHQTCFPIPYQDSYFAMLANHCDKDARLASAAQFKSAKQLCQASKILSQCEPEDLTAFCCIRADCGEICALISAQRVRSSSLEAWDLVTSRVASWFTPAYMAGYILTLGVFEEYRRLGLGAKLLQSLIDYYRACHPDCQYLYLHVLHSNTAALRLYESHGFFRVRRLENYYLIQGQTHDAFLYYFKLQSDAEAKPAFYKSVSKCCARLCWQEL